CNAPAPAWVRNVRGKVGRKRIGVTYINIDYRHVAPGVNRHSGLETGTCDSYMGRGPVDTAARGNGGYRGCNRYVTNHNRIINLTRVTGRVNAVAFRRLKAMWGYL